MKTFFVAMAHSYRAGYSHRSFGTCGHRHRNRSSASVCASKQPTHPAPRILRRWVVAEIVMVKVRRRATPGGDAAMKVGV